ncbi:MAG TPA: hypothetical protein VHG93_00140 [Longimicrobium sp.]|nr:hypothetical protein [Longimicrobium sp.]
MSTNLLAEDYRQRSLVYFALGGSGARALEPLLHLCALGLGPAQLRVLLVDPDQANAAITRARRLMDQYRGVRARLAAAGAAGGYFRTEVLDILPDSPVWSPIADDDFLPDTRFGSSVDRQVMEAGAPDLGTLFDLLNARRVREMDLSLGFRGVPSVGTVFMNRLRGEEFFSQLLSQHHANAAGNVFFAAGSVFGGTGAAALPVVGRALRDGIRGVSGRADVRGAARERIGAALVLPYFTLPTPTGAGDGGPRPENALFAHNAAGALPSYLDRERDPGYGGYYLVGDSLPREQERNEVGGEAQANAAHYVEAFTALAALDFAARGGEPREGALPVYRALGVAGEEPGWADLPLDRDSRAALQGGLVAMHTFLSFFRPNGGATADLGAALNGVTWAWLLRLPRDTWSAQSETLDALGRYWMTTWEWLRDLRRSRPALRLAGVHAGPPTSVGAHALIEGYGRSGERGRRTDDVYSVFRYWNAEAANRKNGGFPAFMDVMRTGSERFARDRYAESEQRPQEVA